MSKYIAQLGDMAWLNVFIISAVIAAGYYFLLYDDGGTLTAAYHQSTTKLAESERLLKATEKEMEDANRFEAEVQETARQFERINEYMPPTMQAVDLNNLVLKQARLAGVNVSKMEPRLPNERREFYEKMRVHMALEGTYPQVLTFLSYISRLPRLLTFENMDIDFPSIKDNEDSPMLSFDGTLIGYRYMPTAESDPTKSTSGPGIPGVPGSGGGGAK